MTAHIDACMSNPEKAKKDAEKNKFESIHSSNSIILEEMMKEGGIQDIEIKKDDNGTQKIIS